VGKTVLNFNMAGAGQPWYMPLTWPLGHIGTAVSKPEEDKDIPKPSATPYLTLVGHLTSMAAATRSWALAYLCIFHLPQQFGQVYPAFGPGKEFHLDWMALIVARNLIATWVICGFWDWFLYFSPLQAKLAKYKMNPQYPSFNQIKHDAMVTTSASCCGAAVEILLCHLWAVNKLPAFQPLSEAPVMNLMFALLVTHYRIPHFHAMHRAMHPWKTTSIPDLGKFLYRQVHALHHKSYNPTAFSGTNMHPVEATLYYSAALIPVALGLHPVHALAVIIDCAMGAWLGHDGFQWPGSGDYFHMLHHKHFDCNYGAMHVPLDWLFGTYAGCKEEVSKIWHGQKSGEEANETPVHTASAKSGKVE